jgi:hypothetical protein
MVDNYSSLKKIRKIVIGLFMVLVSLWWGARETRAQTKTDWINNFDFEIRINQDSSISIKETIDYETTVQKHGIYRYIPVSYEKDGWSYRAQISDFKVKDELGQKISFSDFTEGKNKVFKIGEADRTFVGQKTYVLEYRVEDALGRFEEYDELYWDISGEGWQIPIKKSEARVISDFATIKRVDCFSGTVGRDDELCVSEFGEKEAIFNYPEEIGYGQNFTVLVGMDKNNLIKWPSKVERILKWVKENFFVFLIPCPMILMFAWWFFKGRDRMFLSADVFNLDESRPQKLRPLFYRHRNAFVYEPIKELTPGEAGLVLDEKVNNQDVVAEIIELARKKYLRIEKEVKKGFLSKKEDYKFVKLEEGREKLSGAQKYLLDNIFEKEDEVSLGELKGIFYQKMEKTRKLIYEAGQSKKLFVGNPSNRRTGALILAFMTSGASFFFAVVGVGLSGRGGLVGIALVQTVISLIIAWQMPQKTAVGTNLMLQAKGLKEMIRVGKWREEIKEKNLFIEEVLPFAIALGVVGKLVKDMEGLNIKVPEYFSGMALSTSSLGRMVNDFSARASSGLSYNPNSSNWSGGGGFSGGGGSSGGGGGGGGGGSW